MKKRIKWRIFPIENISFLEIYHLFQTLFVSLTLASLLLDKPTLHSVYLGLVDIMYAFAYNHRINEGESNVRKYRMKSVYCNQVIVGGNCLDHMQTQCHIVMARGTQVMGVHIQSCITISGISWFSQRSGVLLHTTKSLLSIVQALGPCTSCFAGHKTTFSLRYP